jgi:phosphoserine phosphatase RsbU/P
MKKTKFFLLIVVILVCSIFAYSLDYAKEAYLVCTIIICAVLGMNLLKEPKINAPIIEGNTPQEQKENDNQKNELDIARRVQQALISYEDPNLSSIKISKQCIPADSIGGDFYTFINKINHNPVQKDALPGVIKYTQEQENYLGIAIGDVAGHGISSALVMALSAGLIDKIASHTYSASKVLTRANEDIRKFISSSRVSHLTCLFGFLNTDTLEFRYAKAGHHPALVLHKNKEIDVLNAEGIFLGMFEDENYKEHKYQLTKGDRLILYTDGIIEANNTEGEIYGLKRMKTLLKNTSETPINDVKDMMFKEAEEFSKGQSIKDDQTLIIIEV